MKGSTLNETKPIITSLTFWGAIVTLLSVLAMMFGTNITGEKQVAITESLTGVASGISFIIGQLMVIWGRKRATKTIV